MDWQGKNLQHQKFKGVIILQYPKPIMSLTELTELGFSRNYLNQMAHRRNQKCCTRVSDKGKSKFLFDVEKLEKERERMLSR